MVKIFHLLLLITNANTDKEHENSANEAEQKEEPDTNHEFVFEKFNRTDLIEKYRKSLASLNSQKSVSKTKTYFKLINSALIGGVEG